MSKQVAPLTLIDLNAADAPCCPPLTERRLPAETAAMLAPAFKALGDPVRLQLMSMIASAPDGEACVCDLTPYFDLAQPTVSHHLKVLHPRTSTTRPARTAPREVVGYELRDGAGLLERKSGPPWAFYKARPEAMDALRTLFTETISGTAGAERRR